MSLEVSRDRIKTVSILLKELYTKYVTLINGLASNEKIEIYFLNAPNVGHMNAKLSGVFSKASYSTQLSFNGNNVYNDGT